MTAARWLHGAPLRLAACTAAAALCADAWWWLLGRHAPEPSPIWWFHVATASLLAACAARPEWAVRLANRKGMVVQLYFRGFPAPPDVASQRYAEGLAALVFLTGAYALRVAFLGMVLRFSGDQVLLIPLVGSALAAGYFASALGARR